ncbi:MAG: hypothetical protein EBV73_05840, partial [Rhodocyclales bacterium]|nr:hypothetical protein [Rhodocyclales bacterium]
GTHWDSLFQRDTKGILKQRMMDLCDGEYQTFKSKDGAYVREHFFNTPELKALVADWTDDEVWQLNRGGHDIFKIFAAYDRATKHKGQPTLILQNYVPEDHDQLMFYKETKDGQVLQEGINEAGAMSDWIAAATAYSVHGVQTIPFYICYSMFGLQRTLDLCWAAGDQRARGFLIGGTAGRTTLNGEGLQHEDGHSLLLANMIPNCVSYDPTFQYEVAVVVQDGMRRMHEDQEDIFYYLTVMNENYEHPEMPAGAAPDIIKGMYSFKKGAAGNGPRVQLLGSGTIFREVIAAAELLRKDWGVESDLWGCPSFNELARDGEDVARWNMLHPTDPQRISHVESKLGNTVGPVVAATDYIKLYAEQIRPFIKKTFIALGTNGFGRSDTREHLRNFFEVDRHWVTVAALKALADEGTIGRDKVAAAITKYQLDPNKPNPMTV